LIYKSIEFVRISLIFEFVAKSDSPLTRMSFRIKIGVASEHSKCIDEIYGIKYFLSRKKALKKFSCKTLYFVMQLSNIQKCKKSKHNEISTFDHLKRDWRIL